MGAAGGTAGDETHPTPISTRPLAGAFLMHVASSCPLAANGSVLDFDFAIVFNKNPLVCYDASARSFVGCDQGLLRHFAANLATRLNNDTAWVQRAEDRPQARIIPLETGNARAPVRLTCHVWGFYPAEVTVIWLRNGDVLGPGDHPPIAATPNGDWTYQTRVVLTVAPEAGDIYTCSVQHASLDEPLLEDWKPGLTLGMMLKVAAATVLMVLGIGFFLVGFSRCRARPPAPGYTPLPGDNHPAGST
nr:PREDICTED: class II histocompatibility antigen, M beta 1 chain [Apteryx mantelli mantelli]